MQNGHDPAGLMEPSFHTRFHRRALKTSNGFHGHGGAFRAMDTRTSGGERLAQVWLQ